MKIIAALAGLIGGVVLCYILLSLGVVDRIDGIPGTQEEPVFAIPTYLSFVSAMMTAVTVVLAAVAIGVGLVAAYTFREIKEHAERAASEKIENLVAEKLSDEAIKARVAEIAYATGPENELDEAFDPDDVIER
ncbi:MAG: hypothetical protein KDC18_14195 [Alphaproteobacteria bacterium]|nr:hypothetical protein [Alphaproteobacteria bacterium]